MFKHEGDNIFLNGLKIPISVFKILEPSYASPSDLVVMFYDGKRRNYRTKTQSWNIAGSWRQGDRYLLRIEEYRKLMQQLTLEPMAVATTKDKYPKEDSEDVKLQQRDDIKPKRTKGVRSEGKRAPRGGNKHQRGAVGGSSE
jgi:hypothetical protein